MKGKRSLPKTAAAWLLTAAMAFGNLAGGISASAAPTNQIVTQQSGTGNQTAVQSESEAVPEREASTAGASVSEGGASAEREAQKETGTGSESETRKETGTVPERETRKETGTGSESETQKETGTVSERETQTETETGSESETKTETEVPSETETETETETTDVSGNDISGNDISGNDVKGRPMRAPAAGTLQAQIDQADSEAVNEIKLERDYTENIQIPDNKTIILDLNGHMLYPDESDASENGTENAIKVYGKLTIKDSVGGGGLSGSQLTDSVKLRGIWVERNADLTMDGIFVEHFHGNGNGGAVYAAREAALCLQGNAEIRNNTADEDGGGIYIAEWNDRTQLNSGTISGNTAENGGGIAVGKVTAGSMGLDQQLTLSGNRASVGRGGGLYVKGAADKVVIADPFIATQNSSEKEGGALAFEGKIGELSLRGSGIHHNESTGNGGGGLFAGGIGTTLLIEDSAEVYENKSFDGGGGIRTAAGVTVKMTGGCIHNNTAKNGGGILVQSNGTNKSSFEMSGGCVRENHTKWSNENTTLYGGGIYVGSSAAVTIRDSAEIRDNGDATCGGGLYQAGSGSFVMTGGRISGNHAERTGALGVFGGGLMLEGGGTAEITGGVIEENSCALSAVNSGNGGGISCGKTLHIGGIAWIRKNEVNNHGGGINASGSVTIDGQAVIEENKALNLGGGLDLHGGRVEVKGEAAIRKNQASQGGGIGVSWYPNQSVYCVTISENAQIIENQANYAGGGIRGGRIKTQGGRICNNRAGSYGGGIFTDASSEFSAGIITENSASYGGGIWQNNAGTTVAIKDTVQIMENRASSYGGGICQWRGSLLMEGGTVCRNTAVKGGGIARSDQFTSEGEGIFVKGGQLCDNHSTTIKGGNDLYLYTMYENGKDKIATGKEILTLTAAKNMKTPEGSGTAWRLEADDSLLTDEIRLTDTQCAKSAYGYTLEDGSEGMVAVIGEEKYATVQAAVDALNGKEGTIRMIRNSRETVVIPGGTRVTLDLSGYILEGSSGSVITVEEAAHLVLQDNSEAKTGKIIKGSGTLGVIEQKPDVRCGGGLLVYGEAILESGTICQNSATANYGTGVYITGNAAKFTMKGGTITKNNGDGVCVAYRAQIKAGIFEMEGGTISSNAGFGVLVGNSAAFRMNGGEIVQNKNCGVYLEACKMEFSDGLIAENTTSGHGGGIQSNNATLIMTDGIVEKNTAQYGGGLYINGGKVELTGGVVRENTAKADNGGGGVCFWSTSSGNLSQNVRLYGNKVTAGAANDIWISSKQKVSLLAAADMGMEEYDCWYDGNSGRYLTEQIVTDKNTVKGLALTATKLAEADGVARIGDTVYTSLTKAIAAAQENDEIYLCQDWEENAAVSKPVTLDLNGYTLASKKNNSSVLTVTGKDAVLTLRSTEDQKDHKAGSVGMLTLGQNLTSGRGVEIIQGTLILESGRIQGFSGMETGGAVYGRKGATFEMTGGELTKNSASEGGAVYMAAVQGSTSTGLYITGGSITDNEAVKGNGGGILVNATNYTSKILVSGAVKITGNRAAKVCGGLAVLGSTKTELEILNGVLFEGNFGETGGAAIYLTGGAKKAVLSGISVIGNSSNSGCCGISMTVTSGQQIEVTDTVIRENETKWGSAAGYFSGKALLTNVEVIGNKASGGNGGGLSLSGSSETTLTDCLIRKNEAYRGGGLAISSQVQLVRTTITENIAEAFGGGICAMASGIEILGDGRSSIEKNTAKDGGGIGTIWGSETITLEKLELRDNKATSTGGGIRAGKVTLRNGVKILNNTSSGSGGGIWGYSVDMYDGLISGNHAGSEGGGIVCSGYGYIADWYIRGGVIENNTAAGNGGGICRTGSGWHYSQGNRSDGYITGGVIRNNTAGSSGGGVYLADYACELTVSGGRITGNIAANAGGGIYVASNCAGLQLKEKGQLFDNLAKIGQDVYASYNKEKTSKLELIRASDMTCITEDGETLIENGWYDEQRSQLLTDAIKYDPVIRAYGLTLRYGWDHIVAMIGDKEYNSVQAAVDAIRDQTVTVPAGETPVIRMVADSRENVIVPAKLKTVLNLNGHTLTGNGTAITCLGDLRIQDVKADGDTTSGDGTITGTALYSGGGIWVKAGGSVVLESGRLYRCKSNGGDYEPAYGGAGVRIDQGSFELTGKGLIERCSARYGAAVYVGTGSSVFRMSGGTIQNNSSTRGAVYMAGGTFRMTAGTLESNSSYEGGGIYLNGGRAVLNGGKIQKNTATIRGGGLFLNGGRMQLRNISILENRVTAQLNAANPNDALGGGIYTNNAVLSVYEGTQISGNRAPRGGGIGQFWGEVRMTGGTITDNRADYGGGIAMHPTAKGKCTISGGGIYGNWSRRTDMGNDIYSAYEGTGEYPGTRRDIPSMTLLPASWMKNAKYNVWRDDTYTGTNRKGEAITEGEYITGQIADSANLQLTAASYGYTARELKTTMQTESLFIRNTDGEDGMRDGVGKFDKSQDAEKTAQELLEDGSARESEETYRYNGEELKKISYNGQLYERSQIVTWNPGDDSNAQNTLVRAFDTVSYTLTTTVGNRAQTSADAGTSEKAGTQTGAGEEAKTLRLWLQAELPYSSAEAEFTQTSSFNYCNIEYQEDAAGKETQILRGYWEIDNAAGTISKNVSIRVKGMKNADTFKPKFREWIGGNEENEQNPVTAESKLLTVSAAPYYNVSLLRNSALAYTGWFNLETGEKSSEEEAKAAEDAGKPHKIVYGTMLGYGITLSLYNKAGRDLLGTEAPGGEINFDLELSGSLYLNGSPIAGKTAQAPYLWAYKENSNTPYGTNFDNTSYSFRMNWNDEDDVAKTTQYAWDAAPFNSGGGANSCYGGGAWYATGRRDETTAKTKVHFNVEDYLLNDDANPYQMANGAPGSLFHSGERKPFSAGYIQVIFPFDPKEEKANGYLEINMNGMVSDLNITSVSGQEPQGSEDGIEVMENYFGTDWQKHAVREMQYRDNWLSHSTGLYIFNGKDGNSDSLGKNNQFLQSDRAAISGPEGTGSTPIGSTVYIHGGINFGSRIIDTGDPNSGHYIPPEEFNPQKDNKVEYNYMTAMNLLQKFDADAYTPYGTDKVIQKVYRPNSNAVSIGNGAFYISTTEDATTWSKSRPYKTQSYELTILYAAKPDGTNWTKASDAHGDDGGTADMDKHREEHLIYFETLQELYKYFGQNEDGSQRGHCVAILYQFRDCCIRTGRSFSVQSKMKVTDEFEKTGSTYCTTNDARCWSTYRPEYKEAYGDKKLSELLYQYNWHDTDYRPQNGITAYGTGNGTLPAGYSGMQQSHSYWDGYIKTEYADGSKVGGTHNGYYSGNSLLLYTLESSIAIRNTDKQAASNKTKREYNLSEGERTANFRVQPMLQISSATKDHELVVNGTQQTVVEITLDLPKGLHYEKGSLRFNYSAAGCKYGSNELAWEVTTEEAENGTSKVKLRTSVSDISKGLPEFYYACSIGTAGGSEEEDVESGKPLTTRVKINTTYEEHNNLTCAAKTASVDITPIRTMDDQITKTTEKNLTELGGDLVYTLHYKNTTSEAQSIEFCDVLPYNGDGRGTSFTGAYRIKAAELLFATEESYNNFREDGSIRYASGQTVPGESERTDMLKAAGSWTELMAEPKGELNGKWVVTLEVSGIGKQEAATASASALFGKMKIASESTLDVKITLSPCNAEKTLLVSRGKTQSGGSSYWNNYFYRSTSSPVSSQTVFIKAVSRTITGTVWLDQDQDGEYQAGTPGHPAGDKILQNVDVYLYTDIGEDGSAAVTVEGKTLYPVQDITGKAVGKKVTGKDGKYTFTNLKAGTYYVVLKDDGGDYKIGSNAAEPLLGWSQLSVTPKRDTLYYDWHSLRETDKALPVYTKEDTEQSGAAPLDCAVIQNGKDGKGIQLPKLDVMQTAEYITNRWNCGLYYTELTLQKNWEQTVAVPAGTQIELGLSASVGSVRYGTAVYKMTQNSRTVSDVTTILPTVDSLPKTVNTSQKAAVSADSGSRRISWTIPGICVQAEGAGGVITYQLRETAKDQNQNSLTGFIETIDSRKDGTKQILTATNTQQLYDLELTKYSLGTNDDGSHPAVPGAEFTLYLDEACKKPVPGQSGIRSGTDGKVHFTGLAIYDADPAGIWYLKETKTPSGYTLNKGIFKIQIIPASKEAGPAPQVTITCLTEEQTGKKLEEPKQLTNVTLEAETEQLAEQPLRYRIGFEVYNECIWELPKTGGTGVLWNLTAGVGMLLAALWMLHTKKKKGGKKNEA